MIRDFLWKECLRHREEPVLFLSLRRPETDVETRQTRRLARYYERLDAAWRHRWTSILYPRACQALEEARNASRPFQPWAAGLDYHVTFEDDHRLSICMKATEQGPGPHIRTVGMADTWEQKTGLPLTLGDCLPEHAHRRRAVIAALSLQAQQQLEGGESLLFSDVQTRVGTYFSPDRFYLTPDGVAIFYPMLTLGARAEGLPTFLLPRQVSPH